MPQHSDKNNLKPTVKKNVDLTFLNTLGVQAVAPEFIEIHKTEEITELGHSGYFQEFNPFILGGGSNVLFKKDLDIPVLKISIKGIEIAEESSGNTIVVAGAGENWHDTVKWAVDNNLGGIENLALIPGTTGAAPIQNIGAYGVELSSVVEFVEFYDINDRNVKRFNAAKCRFGYRDSIFKNEMKGEAIVTRLAIRLTTTNHQIIDHYHSLKDFFEKNDVQNPTIKDVFDAVIAIRKSKLPDPALLGNAGSFFKNPVVKNDHAMDLKAEFEDIPLYDAGSGHKKIPAGWMIEKAGWKGKKVGNVGTYKNQALVIVNHGGATGGEIFKHALRIQKSVKNKFGIELTPEVNVIG